MSRCESSPLVVVGVTCDDVQWTGRVVAFQVVAFLQDILQVDISSECSDNIEGSCGEEPICTHRCHTRDDSVASIVQYCRSLVYVRTRGGFWLHSRVC